MLLKLSYVEIIRAHLYCYSVRLYFRFRGVWYAIQRRKVQRDHRQIDASGTRLEDRVAFILLFTNNEPAHPGIIDSGAYARVFAVLERIADFVFFFITHSAREFVKNMRVEWNVYRYHI